MRTTTGISGRKLARSTRTTAGISGRRVSQVNENRTEQQIGKKS